MKEILNTASGSMLSTNRNTDIHKRIFRTMLLATAIAVIASLFLAPWRVTSGLLLGGLLSLLNHYWLSGSTTAAFNVVLHGTRPRIKLAQYVLRYFVIAAAVFLAYKFDVVSLTATILGLCSFVVGLFVEAFREIYYAITHQEEIS